ncbi:helix-turn-helix domain-containing protein [Vreelandella profundi]|uniref:helix-turn-helix domain-containing protein n=1 Tax=Vreelandella profundi TaxID=2852117 RepID=UPI001EF015C0|nr:helix-turn-helix domain-containing protein [Halomonas profundi]
MSYVELSIDERVSIQLGQALRMSQRHITRLLGRASSTIFREIRRYQKVQDTYFAQHAQQQRD